MDHQEWAQLKVTPFETVVAIKGVQFINITEDPQLKQEIINCATFQDSIITVRGQLKLLKATSY